MPRLNSNKTLSGAELFQDDVPNLLADIVAVARNHWYSLDVPLFVELIDGDYLLDNIGLLFYINTI